MLPPCEYKVCPLCYLQAGTLRLPCLRSVHTSIMLHCGVDISITFLPQLNTFHVKMNLTLLWHRNLVTLQSLCCECSAAKQCNAMLVWMDLYSFIPERFSRAGPRWREWATLGVHPLSWLLSNNWLEKVPVVSVPHTSSNRLLLSNQDKGCTPSVAHSLPLPPGPALLNLWTVTWV